MPMQSAQQIMADISSVSSDIENTTSTMEPASSPSSGRPQRQRLKPWLKDQIDSGRYPGVQWVNKQEETFRIPWKHCGRADWLEQDGLLYKAWATHTGRFTEGVDKPDWPTWKTRLRCALNKMKPDIVWLEQESTLDDVEDPYRVYKFNSKRGPGSASPPQQQQHTPQSVYSEDSSTCSSPSPFCLSPHPANVHPQPNIPSVVEDTAVMSSVPTIVHGQGHDDPVVSSLGSSLGMLSTDDLMAKQTLDLSYSHYLDPGDASVERHKSLVSPPQSMETDSLKDSLKDEGYQKLSQLIKLEPRSEATMKDEPDCGTQFNNYSHGMILMVRYRVHRLAHSEVYKKEGCRVYHGDTIPPAYWYSELFGDKEADQLFIPDVSAHLEQNQKDLVDYLKLLKALQLGISIFMQDNDIYVLRRCQASVFTAPANQDLKQAIKVERNQEPLKVFDFNNAFLPAFQLYQKGQGPRPSPLVVFGFGQPFRADDHEALYESLLLSVTVCHSQASQMLAQLPPDSPPLQISHSNEYDCLLEHMKNMAAQNGAVTQAVTLPS